MQDPNYLKSVAPKTAARIRAYVNANPRLKDIIQIAAPAGGLISDRAGQAGPPGFDSLHPLHPEARRDPSFLNGRAEQAGSPGSVSFACCVLSTAASQPEGVDIKSWLMSAIVRQPLMSIVRASSAVRIRIIRTAPAWPAAAVP